MRKKFLALTMSALTIVGAITGCGVKDTPQETTQAAASKLDSSVKVEDLLAVDDVKSLLNATELKDFVGALKINLNVDASLEMDEEASDIKMDLDTVIASDGKVLHTKTDATVNVMGEESKETSENWYSDETKTLYYQTAGSDWIKDTDKDFKSVISEYIGGVSAEELTGAINVDDIVKDFELVLNHTDEVYELKYETGINDLLNKLPEDVKAEMSAEGMDINALVESLNLPKDFKISCMLSFNADKTFKDMAFSVSAARIDLSEILGELFGTTFVIDLKSVEIKLTTTEVGELVIPEEALNAKATILTDDFE